MTICPDNQHHWGPWVSAPIPGFVHVGNGILDHPVLLSGIPIDWRTEAQHWFATCTRPGCGSRVQARPTVPRADTPTADRMTAAPTGPDPRTDAAER